MADNVVANAGSGGATFASDDIGGVQYPRTKVSVGADGSATDLAFGQGAMAASIPVAIASNQSAVPVSNAGTFATQVDGAALTALQLIDNVPAVDDAAFTAASGYGSPMMGFVTADSVDSGDVGVVGMLANRQLKVTLYDSSANELAVGGGTQYTEDAAATANPVGNALIVVREDARAGSLVSADGDNVALRGNNYGELYVKHTDALTVNSHAVTNTGTFATQAAQSGTWNIGTVTTVTTVAAVTAISNALPAGTNAIGKLAANSGVDIGDIDVTSVVPGVGATNLGKAEDAAHASGDVGVMALSVRQDTAAALAGTDADYQPLITDASGRLHVNVGNTVTVGSHAVTNAGTFAVQIDSGAVTSLALIDDPVIADDAAFTPATSKVMMAGFQADESSTDSVDEGDAGAARMTLDRKIIVTNQPHSAGGLSIYRSIDLDEGTLEVIKNAAGAVYGMWVTNTATATRFIKFYDAASGTLGTGTPVITIGIPGNSSDDIAGNFGPGGIGIQFSTGICFGASTGVADADTGAPGTNDVICNVFYK